LGLIYRCSVNNNLRILTKESAEINSISGTHEDSKSNDDVLGFLAYNKTIQSFPKGLDKFFKNLQLIYIQSCQLKEIHQIDLKFFPNLTYFYLAGNQIEVIEEGLFDFNPNLEVVGFYESKIIHIDPNVFNHLTKLSNFWFSYVRCVNKYIVDSKEKVQKALKIVKSKCSSSEFLSLVKKMKDLEINSKILNSEDFNKQLLTFEKRLNSSKFFKFRPLNYKFQNLKLIPRCSDCVRLNNNSSLNVNKVNSGNNLSGIIILTSFLPLILHFLPKNVFEKM